MKKLTTEEFINRSKAIHKDKYDYSKTNYVDAITKVIIHCNECGKDFEQSPDNHLHGHGCPICNGGIKDNTETFIEKAKKVHGDKYDYSKVNYVDSTTPILIGCPIHGFIEQKPIEHLRTQGCPKCFPAKSDTEEFIRKAKEIHNDKYDYSKVNYTGNRDPVVIYCPQHDGDFLQRPHEHLAGHGCPICNGGIKYTQDQFIQKSHEIHGDLFEYDRVNYVNSITPVLIKCKTHGYFLQRPVAHLFGRGCPICNASQLEMEIFNYCTSNKINYFMHYTWDWLINIRSQEVDFYLPDFNSIIECQGIQHFGNVDFFGDTLETIIARDNNKKQLCLDHGLKVFYFSDMIRKNKASKIENFSYPYEVFEDIDKLFLEIMKQNSTD